jgi:cytochrome c biogenesis protein CcdA
MLKFNHFKQKSLQQRFLFILRLAILFIYLGIGLILIFFSEIIHLDPDLFKRKYQIAFGIILIVYGLIRFARLIKEDNEA